MKIFYTTLLTLLTLTSFAQYAPVVIDGDTIWSHGRTAQIRNNTGVGYFITNWATGDSSKAALCFVVDTDTACFVLSSDSFYLYSTSTNKISGTGGGGGGNISTINVTYAEAQALVAAGTVLENRWYNITTDSIYLMGVTDSSFSLNGYYADSVIWEVDAIEFDFENRHIQLRVDSRGNRVGASFLAVIIGSTLDPIPLFWWGNDLVANNTVSDAYMLFDFGNDSIAMVGNTVSNASFLDISQRGARDVLFVSVRDFSDVILHDQTSCKSCTIIESDFTATGNASCLNCDITNSAVTISDSVVLDNSVVRSSIVTATDNVTMSDANIWANSDITVSGDVQANAILLYEGNEVELSDSVNAIGVRMYSAAKLFASDYAMVEGLIIQNVSVVTASGTSWASPGFICNESTVTFLDSADMGDIWVASSNIVFTDSADCFDCKFLTVNDTIGGSLASTNYTLANRSEFIQKLQTNVFTYTNGTQGAGKILASDANGSATWKDHTAYGEMGFGDSTRTIALTQNVFSVVTNSNNTLWSTAAVDLHNVTYSGDSLIIDSAGTYQVNVQLSIDGTSGSVIRLGVFINGVLACSCTGYQELLNNRIIQLNYINIDALNAGDVLQVVITNTANNDDVDAVGGKITINKIR